MFILIRGVNLISEAKRDVYLNVNLISVRSTKGGKGQLRNNLC